MLIIICTREFFSYTFRSLISYLVLIFKKKKMYDVCFNKERIKILIMYNRIICDKKALL